MKKICVVSLNRESNNLRIAPTSSAQQQQQQVIQPAIISHVTLNQNSNDGHSVEDSDEDDYSESESTSVDLQQPTMMKRKRQKLSHLTPEEKLMRRKLKNRIAAQAARDRKKDKFEDLQVTLDKVKLENEKLKKENSLLKEKALLLIDENRKLLKFKTDTEQKAKTQQLALAKTTDMPGIIVLPAVVNKSISQKSYLGADESAVFTNYASQQKKQLQGMFQRMICMLLLQTMALLKRELATSASQGRHQSHVKVDKLKMTLSKLFKLAQARRMLPKPAETIHIMNTYRKAKSNKMSSVSLAMLISVIVRAVDMKRPRQ